MEQSDYICVWLDANENYRATRCTVDIASGKPIGLPGGAESVFIVEFERGHEPTLYDEAIVSEMELENTF